MEDKKATAKRRAYEVGDRVAVYDQNIAEGPYRKVGSVVKVRRDGVLHVVMDVDSSCWSAHPKQCRRLVKPKGRVLYVREDELAKALATHPRQTRPMWVSQTPYEGPADCVPLRVGKKPR